MEDHTDVGVGGDAQGGMGLDPFELAQVHALPVELELTSYDVGVGGVEGGGVCRNDEEEASFE